MAVRDTTAFNNAFTESLFTDLKGEYEAGKVDNSYSTFSAGGQNWMMLNLELWPRQGAIDWAKGVVASHANYNVIVATHSYLEPDGSISQSAGGYGATSPQHLFDTLIKVYSNVKIVLSGHVGGGASRVDTGTNGNKILSVLQCYHSRTTNPVRLLKISVSAGTVKSGSTRRTRRKPWSASPPPRDSTSPGEGRRAAVGYHSWLEGRVSFPNQV